MGTTADTTQGTPSGATKQLTVRCAFCAAWNRVDASRIADKPKCGSCSTPMLFDRPFKLDEDSFDRTVSESTIPVFVDFYADWCGPCKVIAPSVDKLAATYAGKALIAKLDTDRAPRIQQRFGVRGIPTVIVFHLGREVARQSGAAPYHTLEQMLMRACGVGA